MDKQPIKEIVKSEEWQKVRQELLGNWVKRPNWCCMKLRHYLGSVSSTSETKLRIVMNYLTGTAFRIGKIKPRCVILLRAEISAEMKKRKFRNK
jgi:hypothetical protein